MFFGKTIGILGGGQLAKMMSIAASNLGCGTIVFSEDIESCSSEHVKKVMVAPFMHMIKLALFAKECDFITIETENVPVEVIEFLETNFPEKIKTSSGFVGTSQNRLKEKEFASSLGVPTGRYVKVEEVSDIKTFFENNGECILKTVTEGYDGKGQIKIKNLEDLPHLKKGSEYILEQKMEFAFEVSCVVTKQKNNLVFFPVPLNVHKDGILRESIVPLTFDGFTTGKIHSIEKKVIEYTHKIAEHIKHDGTFAVEYFVFPNGDVFFNEMAPRPHNSGHFTNDLCNVSQFESHIRAVIGLPLIEPQLLYHGKMVNIIGNDIHDVEKLLDKPNLKLHLYNKNGVSPNRKLGHYNIIGFK
jgi:5-(carboxyamino)imidazole ribonucleotide synthase